MRIVFLGMRMRKLLKLWRLACASVGLGLVALSPIGLAAQEHPAKRLSNIVGVAVDEYGKAVDARGTLVSDVEYEEAVSFLGDAKDVAARLSGNRAATARGILDSLIIAVGAKRPLQE